MKKLLVLVLTMIFLAQIVVAFPSQDRARFVAHSTNRILPMMHGCTILHELNDATAIECSRAVIPILRNFMGIEEDQIFTIMDLQADQQINADDLWALGYTGSGVTVAVLDTGIDTDHPELADSIAGGKGFGYVTYEDDHGHGTHVSGIITANGVDSNAKGVAPDAKVWMAKVCNAQGSCYASDIAAAIEYVVNNNIAKIMSISLGGGGTSLANCDSDYLASKVNWAVTNGVTVAAAAGNTAGKVTSPGCASKAIAVGAVDKNDARASWSGTGYALDIMAPGVSIYSSVIGGYASWSGTSMATPHISATIALLKQVNSALTDSQIKDALYKTAKDLGAAGWDRYYGWGRVDALAAVNFVLPPTPVHDVAVTNIQAPSSVIKGEIASVQVTVANEGTFNETFAVSLTDTTDGITIGSSSLSLAAGASQVLTFNWDTSTSSIGSHIIKAEASAVEGETDTADNSKTTVIEVKEPGVAPKMHVAKIDMALVKNPIYTYAKATVTIVDSNNIPVEGATVYGKWSGATSDSDSGVTNSNGQVTLQSDRVRRPPAGTTFTFCVGDVTKSGWVYDSSANVETCDSIKV